jgi:hypothetical protein
MGPIWMARGDPNREIGIEQMADNAAAEKSSAAKYGHASRIHTDNRLGSYIRTEAFCVCLFKS